MISLQVVNFYQSVKAAMKIEESKMKNQERNRERKFSGGGSSSGKELESLKWTQFKVLL